MHKKTVFIYFIHCFSNNCFNGCNIKPINQVSPAKTIRSMHYYQTMSSFIAGSYCALKLNDDEHFRCYCDKGYYKSDDKITCTIENVQN